MPSSITIKLPKKLQKELELVIKDESISKSDLICEALQKYLTVKRFRQLRKRVLPFAEAQGILTDEDIL